VNEYRNFRGALAKATDPRLGSVLLSLALGLAPVGCNTKTNHVSINLFGFEESQLHDIATTTETNGSLFLVAYNPRQPSELEWINCPLEVTYDYYEANSRIEETIDIRNEGELELALPLSAKRFRSYVGGGSSLEFRYITVGSYHVARPESIRIPARDPDCNRATHYVSTLSVGAFELRKARQATAGADVGAKVVDVHASGGHEQQSQTLLGDLEACRREEEKGCRTPLQIMMKPLAKRQFDDDAKVMGSDGSRPWPDPSNIPPVPSGTDEQADPSTLVAEVPQVLEEYKLNIDEAVWRPGHFMALALEKVLGGVVEINQALEFGIDGDASAIVGGFIAAGRDIHLNRGLRGGTDYIIFGTGAVEADVDLLIFDSGGNLVAQDRSTDAIPIVRFTPAADDSFSIRLTSPSENFGAIAVMQKDGYAVPTKMLHEVFQNLLDRGANASKTIARDTGASGVSFNEGNLSLHGTILNPGEGIRQSDIELSPTGAIFLAVGHSLDIDLNMEVGSPSGLVGQDTDPDGTPVVIVAEPGQGVPHNFVVQYAKGDQPTLGTSLILRVDP